MKEDAGLATVVPGRRRSGKLSPGPARDSRFTGVGRRVAGERPVRQLVLIATAASLFIACRHPSAAAAAAAVEEASSTAV